MHYESVVVKYNFINLYLQIKEVKRSQQEGKLSKKQNKLVPNT